jgi:hypothetical protein
VQGNALAPAVLAAKGLQLWPMLQNIVLAGLTMTLYQQVSVHVVAGELKGQGKSREAQHAVFKQSWSDTVIEAPLPHPLLSLALSHPFSHL